MSVQNFSFLAYLEVAEKFVVVVGWGGVVVGWSRPSLGFSFSQAEQHFINEPETPCTMTVVYISCLVLVI